MLRAMPPLRERLRRPLAIGLVVVAVYALGTHLRTTLGVEFTPESVQQWVLGLGPIAPVIFVFVVALRSLLGLPSQIVLIAAGLCFGTAVGAVVGGAGLMLSGLFLFSVARYAGREVIEKRLGPRARHVLDFSSRSSGAVAFALACGYPVSPLSPLHAAAGWTPMPVAPNFVASAFAGGLIRATIFAWFGDALTEASLGALLMPLALLGVALAVPLLFPGGRKWLRNVFTPPARIEVAPPNEPV